MEDFNLGGGFTFQGTPVETLGATEYTLVTILLDVTGSLDGFEVQLREMLIAAVQACQKSPRSDNLMVRVVLFSTMFGREGTSEVHGFKPLAEIDPQAYPAFRTRGGTPLYDAAYNGIGAMNAYAKELVNNDYQVNGITFIITDGEESPGASTATPKMIAAEMKKSITGEVLESHTSVLIGMNAGRCEHVLKAFQQDAEITEYRDAGTITPANLAKLAKFVLQSVSSQSQALGTGGPSQAIPATI
jgi:uncharacterized protein YegL